MLKTFKFALFLLVLAIPSISFAQSSVYNSNYSMEPRSFKMAGTVFFDANGNGIHDGEERVYAQSAGALCGSSIFISGLAVRIEYPGFSKEYSISGCGTRGDGVFYETDPIAEGTAISATLVTPSGYKSTWSKTQTLTVQSEQYLSFAVTEFKPEFKITYPNGGEKIEKGATIKIRWKADEYAAVNLILYKGTNCEIGYNGNTVCGYAVNARPTPPTAIAVNVPNTGSYDWKLPSNLVDGKDYRIAIQDPNNLPKIDQSDKVFAIYAPVKKLITPKFTVCKSDSNCANKLIATCGKGSFQIKTGGTSTITVNGKNKQGYCVVQLQHQSLNKAESYLKLNAAYYIPSTVKSRSDLTTYIQKINSNVKAD